MFNLRSISIRNQIALLIVLMTFLSLGVIVYSAFKQQKLDLSEAIEMNTSVASQIQNNQKILLTGAEQLAALVSALPAVQKRDAAAVNSLLASLIKNNHDFTNVIIIDSRGTLWASAIPAPSPLTYSHRRYFKNAIKSGRISSGEFTIGKLSQKPVISFAYPIKDMNGVVTDVMAVVLPLDKYKRLHAGVNAGAASSILLADHKGIILYSSVDEGLVGRQDRDDLFRLMSEGQDSGTFEAIGNLGIKQIFSYKKLWLEGESLPYMFIRTGLSKDFVLNKSRKDLLLGAGALLPAMLLLLAYATYLCKQGILDRIAAFREVTDRIARGDLSSRVQEYYSGSELDELGWALNDMAHRLEQASEAQRESDRNYRELVDNAVSMILKLDPEGNIIFYNEYAERFFGYSVSEIMGRNVIGTIVPETESSGRNLAEMARRIYENPEAYMQSINENICKNGNRVWVSWNNHAMHAPDGTKMGILSVGQDVTERIRIEKELQQSEQRFRSFVENVNDIVFALTPAGDFSYVSPNWTEALGYDLAETVGQLFVQFIHPDDVPRFLEFLKHLRETGDKNGGIEYRVRHKYGDWFWYKANGSLTHDAGSDTVLFIGIGRDITGLKKAQETLHQSEEKFSAAFRASPDAITLTRLSDGTYLEVNDGYTALTGFEPEEVIGKSSMELDTWINPHERDLILHNLQESGIVKNMEFKFRRKDGIIRTGQASARCIEINGQQCLLSVTRDITEQEYLQNELIKAQKLESLSVLAGGIAHNFNNVLTGVIGYISYAKKHLEDTEKVLGILESAEKSTYRAAGIARQLLTFSQGSIPVRKPVAVDTLVEESVSLFLVGTRVKGTINCSSHQIINVDSQQISQAFNNIVLNALHAMPDGGELFVNGTGLPPDECERYSLKPGKYVKITFKDNGCGIEKDDLIKVFDPYFTTRDSGTGLGLSTTHSIIGKHGGHIDISSDIGIGTIVTVILPAYSVSDAVLATENNRHQV